MRGRKPHLLWMLYGALALLPLALALLAGFPASSLWRDLSSGLVILALALFYLQFALSGRFRLLSVTLGTDRIMRLHKILAWAILGAIVLHPFLYVAPRLLDDPGRGLDAFLRLFTADWLRSGTVAWVLMILLVPLAVLRDRLPVPYEVWRLSHAGLAAAIAVLALHHTLAAGSYSMDAPLRAVWRAAAAGALATLVHIYLFKPLLMRRRPMRVAGNRELAERQRELLLEPERGAAPDFAAGQFFWLTLDRSPFSIVEHPFSVATAPEDRPTLGFVIKQAGDFTKRIGDIPVGARAWLDGPHGIFTLKGREAPRLVFIAGGVGFAPVLGMLRHLRAAGDARPMHLLYGNRVEAQILCRGEIEDTTRSLDLRVDLVLREPPPGWTGPVGQLDRVLLEERLAPADIESALFFVCGPPPMIRATLSALRRLGVPPSRTVAERFRFS